MAQNTLDEALENAERMIDARNLVVPDNSTPLMRIIMGGENDPRIYSEILSELPAVSNSVNAQNADEMTALMYAAKKGWGDIVMELLEAGADKALRNNQGETAADLWEAVPEGEMDEEAKEAILAELRVQQPNAGGRRHRRKTKKSRKTKKTRKAKKTRRTRR
jgi:ankyrin repeat protein